MTMTYRDNDLATENEWLKRENLALKERLEFKQVKVESPWTKHQQEIANLAAYFIVGIIGLISLFTGLAMLFTYDNISGFLGALFVLICCIEAGLRLGTGHWAWWRGIE